MSQIAKNVNNLIVVINAVKYVEYAIRINDVARMLLQLESRDADWLAGKISLQLSLQAVELAGKGMLRVLGHSVEDIRNRHGRHDILTLLRQVEKELQGRSEVALSQCHRFLTRTPKINGTQFGTTIGEYLGNHFSKGPLARSRSYFIRTSPPSLAPCRFALSG